MKIQRRRFSPSNMALGAALALATAGCGNGDVLGVHEGRVRFVLSSDVSAVTSADRSVTFTPTLRRGEEGSVAGPDLHSGDDRERDRDHFFASANVTFSSIVARNLDGVLVDVAMDLPVTLDVASMEDGRQIMLPDGELPPATYDQLVVVMTQVEGVTHDGTTITITPPGGGWTSIVPVCPFIVDEGATTVVGLRFNLRRAFKWHDNRFHFEPRFVCEQDEEPDTN